MDSLTTVEVTSFIEDPNVLTFKQGPLLSIPQELSSSKRMPFLAVQYSVSYDGHVARGDGGVKERHKLCSHASSEHFGLLLQIQQPVQQDIRLDYWSQYGPQCIERSHQILPHPKFHANQHTNLYLVITTQVS